MSRAIDLRLKPDDGLTIETFTYSRDASFDVMSELVYLGLDSDHVRAMARLTPDEARVLANQLLQVADTADEQRAARVADDELQASFDEICEELRDAEERGGTGCYYAHPDVHYVPAGQMANKVRELNAAGVKRFMVLADPEALEEASP